MYIKLYTMYLTDSETSLPRVNAFKRSVVLDKKDDVKEENKQLPKDSTIWKSCCCCIEVDKRLFLFTARLAITIILMGFCMVQLIHQSTCESQTLYTSILMTCIGVWLPSPSYNKK